MMNDKFALVTGASQGLGRAFATELAARGIHVLMTALPGENLDSFSASLSARYGVFTDYLECDLTDITEITRLTDWAKTYPLYLLINNAGLGGTAAFESVGSALINNIILVNVRATAMITHQLLTTLRAQGSAWILNVSSMASFSPIGYKTVYPASKVFVQHFSRGLFQELRGSGVFVSVVHPGPMRTNPDCRMRIRQQGILGKIGLITPEALAHRAITRLFKKDSLILVGWMNKINWLLMVTVPVWIRLPLITQVVKREIVARTPKITNHENTCHGRQLVTGR